MVTTYKMIIYHYQNFQLGFATWINQYIFKCTNSVLHPASNESFEVCPTRFKPKRPFLALWDTRNDHQPIFSCFTNISNKVMLWWSAKDRHSFINVYSLQRHATRVFLLACRYEFVKSISESGYSNRRWLEHEWSMEYESTLVIESWIIKSWALKLAPLS